LTCGAERDRRADGSSWQRAGKSEYAQPSTGAAEPQAAYESSADPAAGLNRGGL